MFRHFDPTPGVKCVPVGKQKCYHVTVCVDPFKDLRHIDRESAFFPMLPKTSLRIRYHWYYLSKTLGVLRTNKSYIPVTNRRRDQRGKAVAKFDFTKTFRNQIFSRVRVLFHQYLITNHWESILKSTIMSILMIVLFLLFLSDL